MLTESEIEQQIESKARRVANELGPRGAVMSTAESCTGGWIAQALTAVPGSSAWFDCGFVTYSNESKQRMLNVPSEFFEPDGPGAVSEETARAMSAGALANSRAEFAVAVTGIAGPGGATENKPVGTVWISWQLDTSVQVQEFRFEGSRRQIRLATVSLALDGVLDIFGQFRR